MKRYFHNGTARRRSAFTLVEMMVSLVVLSLLMALIGQLLSSATAAAIRGDKHMDSDSQARAVFDRMAIDFSQIVKRPDVDYFLKDANDPSNKQVGNDQMAFYSQVPGYTASTTSASQVSPVSLVAYRINANTSGNNPYYNQLERLGYGLVWNSSSTTDLPLIFSSTFTSTGTYSTGTSTTLAKNWPNAVSPTLSDPTHEELIGPDVFRLEYYYILRGQAVSNGTSTPSTLAAQLSAAPYNVSAAAPFATQTSVNGLQNVAAISVVIALIDPKSRASVTNAQLVTLAGQMNDFATTMNAGDLEAQWQTAINAAAAIPVTARAGIRVYRRDFYLPQN